MDTHFDPSEIYLAIGEVTSLLAQSPLHQRREIGQIGELILPALMRGQIRIWRSAQDPVGFAIWAWLDATTQTRVLHEGYLPEGDEWACGDRPVIIDFVAPFGGGFRMARDLSRQVFPNRALCSVRRDDEGQAIKIVHWPGTDANGTHQRASVQTHITAAGFKPVT